METRTMLFRMAGVTSEEVFEVREATGDIITLDTDDDISKCKRFNVKTGECLNDDTFFGCSRKLKL